MYARENDLRWERRWANCGRGLDIFIDWKEEKGERRMETREGGMMDVMALVTSRAKRERAGMCCVSYVCTCAIPVKRIREGFFGVGSNRYVYSKHPA